MFDGDKGKLKGSWSCTNFQVFQEVQDNALEPKIVLLLWQKCTLDFFR